MWTALAFGSLVIVVTNQPIRLARATRYESAVSARSINAKAVRS